MVAWVPSEKGKILAVKKRIIEKNKGKCFITSGDIELEIDSIYIGRDEQYIQYKLVNALELARKGCDVAEYYRMALEKMKFD